MKMLVLYDTKHGATAKAAEAIASAAGGVAVALADCPASLAVYDKIVLGAPVYFGRWSKAMAAFATARRGELAVKKLAAFVLGMMPNDYTETVKAALPPELAGKLGRIGGFGGKIDPETLSFGEKFITNMVAKAAKKQGRANLSLDLGTAGDFGRRLADEA